jgi:hypothetical protein
MHRRWLLTALVSLTWNASAGEGKEYRPGGAKLRRVWNDFYKDAVFEPEIDDPLVQAGKAAVPAICEAVENRDMKYRRYAIGALGHIRDRRALPTLERILNSQGEIDYFRGDALRSIYQIDQVLGVNYAMRYEGSSGTLKTYVEAVKKREAWLLESE